MSAPPGSKRPSPRQIMQRLRELEADRLKADRVLDQALRTALPPGRRILFRKGRMTDCASAEVVRVVSDGGVRIINLDTGNERWIHYTDIRSIRPDDH